MIEVLKNLLAAGLDLAAKASPPLVEVVSKSNGRLVALRSGYDLKTVRGPQEHARAHKIGALPDLLAYLKRHGTPAGSTLFCLPDCFHAVLQDDGALVGPGNIIHQPVLTEAAAAWKNLIGRDLAHLKLRDAMEDRAEDLADKGLLAAVKNFKMKAEVNYDADLDEDDAVTFKLVTGQGNATKNGVAKIPKEFKIKIQVLRGWPTVYEFSFRLSFEIRDNRPVFNIQARNWSEVMDKVIEDQIAHARTDLGDGWMVVRGAPSLSPLPTN